MATKAKPSKCVHHWMIDDSHWGICKYCKEGKDFSPVKLLGLPVNYINTFNPFNAELFGGEDHAVVHNYYRKTSKN